MQRAWPPVNVTDVWKVNASGKGPRSTGDPLRPWALSLTHPDGWPHAAPAQRGSAHEDVAREQPGGGQVATGDPSGIFGGQRRAVRSVQPPSDPTCCLEPFLPLEVGSAVLWSLNTEANTHMLQRILWNSPAGGLGRQSLHVFLQADQRPPLRRFPSCMGHSKAAPWDSLGYQIIRLF